MKRSIHIEAPAEKVFDFFKDPRNMPETGPMAFAIKDVKLTDEGVGTYYSWVTNTPVLRMEGFDVYTEFVPNQRVRPEPGGVLGRGRTARAASRRFPYRP